MKAKHFFCVLMLINLVTAKYVSAQTYQVETVYGREAKRGLFDSTLRIPQGLSTRTNANIGDSSGLIALKDTVDGVYYFTGQRWKQLGGSGGGSDGNNYPTSLAFNTSTGVFTVARSGLSSLTQSLDGRYLLIADALAAQDLQSVTNVGNVTNNPIYIRDLFTWDSTTLVYGRFKIADGTIVLEPEVDGKSVNFRNIFQTLSYDFAGLSADRNRTLADISGAEVISVNTKTANSVGAITLTTDDIGQGTTNLYYNDSATRKAVSLVFSTTGSSGAATGTYSNSTGVFTFNIPNYTLAGLGGQPTITLTTTGSSGAATFISNTLNIPNYTLSGLGGLSSTLADGKIWVGNVSNVATAVTPAGDWTLSNAGVSTLATVNSNTGSFGSTTVVPVITVNAKGLVTAVSTATISAGTSLNGTGYVKMSGTTPSYDAVIPIAGGGTNNGSLSVTSGNLFYGDGTRFTSLGIGTTKQTLHVVGGVPAWVDTLANNGWLLNGNAGTTAASNFIGTTDAQSLRVRTNNFQRMVFDSVGFTGINTNAPTSYFDVTGGDVLPTFNAEALTSSGWTSTNWTGSFAGGWSHTTGNTSVLSNTLAAVVGTGYRVLVTVTLRTAGTFTLSFGGVTSGTITPTSGTFYAEVPINASTTGTFSITPSSTFDGTIVVSIKSIFGSSQAISAFKSSGNGNIEVRTDTSLNTFFGSLAGTRNISGLGSSVLTSGIQNTGFGSGALQVNVSGGQNTALGFSALVANTSGYSNTAVGASALSGNTTGQNNIAIGLNAGSTISTQTSNVIIGNNLNGGNTGNRVIISGSSLDLPIGANSVWVGPISASPFVVSSGTYNSFYGSDAGGTFSGAHSDAQVAAFGAYALSENTGSGNVGLGYKAGAGLYSGSQFKNNSTYSTFVGWSAGQYTAVDQSGTANILIGAGAQKTGATTSSEIVMWTGTTTGTGGYNALQWHSAANGGGLLVNNTGAAITTKTSGAALDIQSTTGFLVVPRMTGTQASAVSSPVDGSIVYITGGTDGTFTSAGFWFRDAGAWVKK